LHVAKTQEDGRWRNEEEKKCEISERATVPFAK
jgi:hypothetical protein